MQKWNGIQLSISVYACVSDGFGEETVSRSVRKGRNASVPFARRQEGEEFVCDAIHNAVDFADAACGVNVCNGGKRDPR